LLLSLPTAAFVIGTYLRIDMKKKQVASVAVVNVVTVLKASSGYDRHGRGDTDAALFVDLAE
jgi:hypothetical protein